MLITRFFLLWFVMAGGISALFLLWKAITKTMVLTWTKLAIAGVLSFALAMFIFLMET